MKKKIAILDLSEFFGGGQRFLTSTNKYFNNKHTYHYLVKDQTTFNRLESANKVLLNKNCLLSEIVFINKYLKSNEINTIILNGNRPIYFAPFLYVKNKIAYKHTSNNAFSNHRRFLGKLLLNISYFYCEKIVLLYSAAVSEVFWQKSKVHIINNGVEADNFIESKSSSEGVKFICVSRLDANKGIEWLVKVFGEHFKNHEGVKLIIAGDGNLHQSLKEYIVNRGINNIELLGFVEDITSILRKSDVFVLPSKFESFPLSIIEAMAIGLPVISTETGGISEMIQNNQNGFLINYLNNRELVESMNSFLLNNKTISLMGANSLKKFKEKFTIEKCVEKIEKLYEN